MFVVISVDVGKREITSAPDDDARLAKAASQKGVDADSFIRDSINEGIDAMLSSRADST